MSRRYSREIENLLSHKEVSLWFQKQLIQKSIQMRQHTSGTTIERIQEKKHWTGKHSDWKRKENIRGSQGDELWLERLCQLFSAHFVSLAQATSKSCAQLTQGYLLMPLHIQWITNKDLLSKHTDSDPRAYQSPSAILTSQCLDPIWLYIWVLLLNGSQRKFNDYISGSLSSFIYIISIKVTGRLQVNTLATFKAWKVFIHFHHFRLKWHFDTVPLSVYLSVYMSVGANLLIPSNIWTCLGDLFQME